jgi:Asp-tRNA(Asn)/Glu-tRNA(Gln) amidotransferase A subunit family amidase
MKDYASLPALLEAIRAGEVGLHEYYEGLCDRLDENNYMVQAFLEEPGRRGRLRREVSQLLSKYRDPGMRPPLFGAAVGVKDLFRVNGFPTRAGSLLPAELFDGQEAAAVTALKQAGALILGKTVTTEFAYFAPGPTRNPHNLNHTPGGSSSGSAAAVAAGFCPLALGTQTVGSITRPAAFCGIVGFKPSYGRIAVAGVIPFSQSVDHVGLFTRDAAGIELAASVLCADWRQPAAGTVVKPVLGVPEGPYLKQASPEGLAAFGQQVLCLEQAGYRVMRVQAMADIEEISCRHRRLISAEMADVHSDWFGRFASLYRAQTAGLIREGQQVAADELNQAKAGRSKLRSELEELMDRHNIDLWVSPAALGPAPEGIEATGSPVMNLPWTQSGLPTISLPAGHASNGLPLGLQVAAGFMADEKLVLWAVGLEQALKILKPDRTAIPKDAFPKKLCVYPKQLPRLEG